MDYIAQIILVGEVMTYLVPVVMATLFLVGIIGNSLVIYITIVTKRFITHPVVSILVLNLAVSDIIYLTSSAPFQALTIAVSGWNYGSFICSFLHFLSIQTMGVSIYTMCIMAVMRYLALLMPFNIERSFVTSSPKLTSLLLTCCTWILASIIALPNILYFRVSPANNNTTTQNSSNNSVGIPHKASGEEILQCAWGGDESDKVYRIFVLILTYALPLLLVTILYLFIGIEIYCYISKKSSSRGGEQTEFTKTTMMVFVLVVAFLICWFPHHLFAMIEISGNYNGVSYALLRTILKLVGLCFSYAHACVNPILYTFVAPDYKSNLKKLLRRCPQCSKWGCIQDHNVEQTNPAGRTTQFRSYANERTTNISRNDLQNDLRLQTEEGSL